MVLFYPFPIEFAIWSCDFLTQYTIGFRVFYLFLIMEIETRRIVYWNLTDHPTLPWIQQQIREATAWGRQPRFLIHDGSMLS